MRGVLEGWLDFLSDRSGFDLFFLGSLLVIMILISFIFFVVLSGMSLFGKFFWLLIISFAVVFTILRNQV